MAKVVRIGTASWAIPRCISGAFSAEGSGLVRYAANFNATEINSTFRRGHRPQTWQRWATSTPDDFKFAVKVPKTISHELRLTAAEEPLARFLGEINHLGEKLGPLLLQLPPSFAFNAAVAKPFFALCRKQFGGALVCEPRHPTWFADAPSKLMANYGVARVAADPVRWPGASDPKGENRIAYYRLHGAPRVYYSSYDQQFISNLATTIQASDAQEVWCIFDNTASGAATANAIALKALIAGIDV